MDSAYDALLIKAHSESLGHIPLIDKNPRTEKGISVLMVLLILAKITAT